MKRYVREKEDLIYDRLRRKHITVRTERLVGNLYHINAGDDIDEAVISRGDIDEPSGSPLPL